MIVVVVKETLPGERCVPLVPETVGKLGKAGLRVLVQPGAGAAGAYPDSSYDTAGAQLDAEALGRADILLKIRPPTFDEISGMKDGAVLIGLLEPANNRALLEALAGRKITAFAMELLPRLARAQPMDVLSSMSTVAGYKAVLLAANRLGKFFPLLMTAAGTITPARVFVIGAGVAGLQAIATARRLGAVVEAYDTRPAVREQVASLGARFVELNLPTGDAEGATGYARAQSEEFYQRQQALMSKSLTAADVVITTANVPGRRAPVLISEDMVRNMRPGSVIVDLAAEQGGNCALTQAGQEIEWQGVTILGPVNLPSMLPYHSSQMYSSNFANYLLYLFKDGRIHLDLSDELTRDPLVTHGGEILYKGPNP